MYICFKKNKKNEINTLKKKKKRIFIIKELQSIVKNHSADIDYEDFVKICRKCKSEPYSFLTIDTKLPADNPLRFRKNRLDSL